MNLQVISRNVGFALLVSSFFMLLSVGVSIAEGVDSAFSPLLAAFVITFTVGAFPFIFVRKASRISLRDGYMIIFLSWTLSFLFGAIPYALWGGPFTPANAWFESVSGYTTTGATILEEVESLPRSLLFWRLSTHFIGGLGVVVFLLFIIPDSSPMRLRLSNMELSSLSKDDFRSRANHAIHIFARVYLGLFAAAFASYLLCGMEVFDAVCHAFSVCATGGFSSRNQSLAAFGSTPILVVTLVFMVLSSLHFGLVYVTFATGTLRGLRNSVLRFYLLALVVISLLVSFSLRLGGTEASWGGAFLNGTFQVVSYASTTGFASADNAAWPAFPSLMLIVVSLVSGCAGSTSGGIKIDRVVVLAKAIHMQINKAISPTAMFEVRMGRRILHDEDVYPHVLYIALYFLLLGISSLLCIAVGGADGHGITGSVAMLGNVGASLGEIGSMGNYNAEPTLLKFLFSVDMLLGRVEIYPVLAVFAGFRTHRFG